MRFCITVVHDNGRGEDTRFRTAVVEAEDSMSDTEIEEFTIKKIREIQPDKFRRILSISHMILQPIKVHVGF